MEFNQDDFKNIQERVMRAKEYVKDWRMNIEKWRNLYNLRHYDRLLNDVNFNDPTHTNTVDLAVGIMLGNKMRWHAYGISPSKREQIETGRIEKLMEGIIEINDQREEKSIMYEFFLNFIRDGGGVLYSVFDPLLVKLEEVEDTDPNSDNGVTVKYVMPEPPIRVQAVDPIKVFALPGGPKRWLLIGRSEQMSVYDVETLYGVTIGKYSSYSTMDKYTVQDEFVDVWDYVTVDGKLSVRNTVMFAGQPIMGPRIMDGYEDLAYTMQFFKPTGTDSKGWHNIMTPMESSVKLLEKTVNRRGHQIDVYTGLPIVSKTQAGRVVQVDAGLFNHVNISTDESIEFPVWPGNAPDVQLHLEFLRQKVNQSGFSDIMFGTNMGGEGGGYAMAQMGDQNRIRLEQPIRHLELMLSSWAKKALNLLSTYAKGTSICVYGHYKGKEYQDCIPVDSLSGYAVSNEIRAHFPAEETRKVAMASQSKGTLSTYTTLERYYDIEQPEDEIERKMIEMTDSHPLVMQYAIMADLKERADMGDEIAGMVLTSIQNQGLPGEAGRPKDETSPAGFSGLRSATGEPTSQEQGGEPAGQSPIEKIRKAASAAPPLMG
jgi:hypothetical protein